MGDKGWSARMGENAMVELLEQNRASAIGNVFISVYLFYEFYYCGGGGVRDPRSHRYRKYEQLMSRYCQPIIY